MPESSLPPPPAKGSSRPLIAVLVAMLVIGGGVAVWKLGDSDDEVSSAEANIEPAEPTTRAVQTPPPPPPPEISEEPDSGAPEPPSSKRRKRATAGSACSGTCDGVINASFRSALRQKAGQARTCYNQGLRQNSALEGKMMVAVRVSPTGRVCSAHAKSNTLGDATVTNCVLRKFRASRFPKPRGGCVDAQVPLNFVPKP